MRTVSSVVATPAIVFLSTFIIASCFLACVVRFGEDNVARSSEDTADYLYAADSIVNGRYVSTPGSLQGEGIDDLYRYYRAPGFPAWLVITGRNALLGPVYAALLALIAYAIATTIGVPRGYAVAVGLLTGLSPTTLFIMPFLLSDLPSAILTTASILLSLMYYNNNKRGYVVLAGVAIGIAALFRPSALAYAIVLMVVLVGGSEPLRRRAVSLGLFAIMLFATIAPWMMNVYRNTGMFKLSTQGSSAFVLYNAHCSRVGGATSAVAAAHSEFKPSHYEFVRSAVDEQDRVRMEWDVGRRIAMENPVKFAVGVAQTAAITIVTPSKDIVGLFPQMPVNGRAVRVVRALISAVFMFMWMYGLVDLNRTKSFAAIIMALPIIVSVALACFAGSVMGQRVMLPALFAQNFLFVLGAVRVFEKAALVEWRAEIVKGLLG